MSEIEEVNQKPSEPEPVAPSLLRVWVQELGFLGAALLCCGLLAQSFWSFHRSAFITYSFLFGGILAIGVCTAHAVVTFGFRSKPTYSLRLLGLGLNVLILVLTFWIPANSLVVADYGLRTRMKKTVGLNELQQWATDILAPLKECDNVDRNDKRLSDARIRKFIAGEKENGGVLVRWGVGNERCVQISLLGGKFQFHSQGVFVGAKTFVINTDRYVENQRRAFKWADGIYGYQD